MKNNFILMMTAFIFITVSLIVSSCNLPQKRNSVELPHKEVENEENMIQNSQFIQSTEADAGLVTNNYSFDWSGPSQGPTVTPIVLGIEKRGEEGVIINRETYPDNNSNVNIPSGNSYYSGSAAPAVNPVQNYSAAAMSDNMEVVNFNPVSGAVVLPGQALHLDVTLKNTGTTTWQTNYKVVDISQSPLTVQKEFNLPYAVAPGGTAVLSIYMTAPSSLSNYTETFQIQDAYGAVFGKFDYIFSVGDFSYVTDIPTLTATITPTYYSAAGITATPDSLAWMCIDPERSKLQDCYSFCVEYSHVKDFEFCFYDGQRYLTPVPENNGG